MNKIQLTNNELAQIEGGLWPWLAGIAGGIAGTYIYDSVGGKAGIDSAVSSVISAGHSAIMNGQAAPVNAHSMVGYGFDVF